MGEARRKRAEEALAEGRRLLESGDVHGALRLLDRARKDFVQEGDLGGVRELRKVVEDGYRLADAQDEPAYERLLYGSAQNVRFLSRKRAAEAKVPWEDPHPEVENREGEGVLASAGYRAGARVLARMGLSLDVGVCFPQLPELADFARAVPELTIILNHLGGLNLRPGERISWKTTYDRFAISKPSGARIGCVDATRRARVSDADSC